VKFFSANFQKSRPDIYDSSCLFWQAYKNKTFPLSLGSRGNKCGAAGPKIDFNCCFVQLAQFLESEPTSTIEMSGLRQKWSLNLIGAGESIANENYHHLLLIGIAVDMRDL
jgi:hypothetical protein